MDEETQKAIEEAGFRVTTVKEFFGLTEEENRIVEERALEARKTARPVITFAFTIIVAGDHSVTDDIANALYEAGCDDACVGSCDSVLTIDFDREDGTLGFAIGSAVDDVIRAGFAVARIDVDRQGITR